MIESVDLQHLRLGPIMKAAAFPDAEASKIHAWRNRNGLRLGVDMGAGNRRYDLGDAARLLLMRQVTEQLLMPAQAAVDLVNAAHKTITLLAGHEYYVIDFLKQVPDVGDWAIDVHRADGSLRPEIRDESVLAKSDADLSVAIRPARVRLNRIVEWARNGLIDAVGGNHFEFLTRLREAEAGAA